MNSRKLSTNHIIIIVLLVIHLSPIWIFKYFPSLDGPGHVYNAYVLKEYHKHENYKLREVYKLNLTIFPNWSSPIILALLMYVFPPIICEKILVSMCIALVPISLFYFLNGVQKGKALFGLIGFIYAYNYLLHVGFYNFALSISLFFFTLGYWWRRRDKLNAASLGGMYVLLLGTYLTHYHSYALLIVSLTFFGVFSSLYEALQKTWGYEETPGTKEKTLASSLKSFAVALKPALLFLGWMLPAYFIMFSYYLAKRGGGEHKGFQWLKDYFFSMRSIVAFRDGHILIGRILLVVFAIAFLLTVINRVRQVYRFRRSSEPGSPKERLWTKIVTRRDQFLLMAVIVTAMFFTFPRSGYGGGWINDRFHVYIFLVLLPFFSIGFHRHVRYAIAGVIIVLSLWHLGYNSHTYYHLSRDIDNMVSSAGMFGEHAILDSRPSGWGGPSDSFGRPKYTDPFHHLPCYLGLKKGVAYNAIHGPGKDYFPIQYRDRSSPAEFILVWRTEYDEVEELEADYDLIHSSNYNRLYRRKKAKPEESLWGGKEAVSFDMQSHNGQTAPDHIPIFGDTVYVDGKYGWATGSGRGEFLSAADIPEPYRDIIWGEEDGVFRVALPNGEYKVTSRFCSGGSTPQEINIIANGEKKIKKLRIPKGNETIERSYTVTITDERLTQVIYTRRKGPYKRWGWSGFTIQGSL